MQDFEYAAASTVEEVISLAGQPGKNVRLLSGGTDLLVQLREGRKQADLVVDIKRVAELSQLRLAPREGLTIGAAVPCYRITGDREIREVYPGLVDAIGLIGGAQIQGRASVGGNLCNASPAADSIPALIVHQAECIIAGPGGRRRIPVEQFCTGPGKNALGAGEFLVALHVPLPEARSGARYLRFIPRNEMDIAVVGVGAMVVLDEGGARFSSARVALGAVAPTPLYVPEVGEYLAGQPVSPDVIFEAARRAQAAAQPISDMRGTAEQRRHLVRVLTRRALDGAVERARAAVAAGSISPVGKE
ncbi:MAG TPA: xanthine dehydrogenase family protein subunit M [Anaerolineaceae bacterium]